MSRVKRGVTKHSRHKKILRMTRGHYSTRHRLYRRAKESAIHAMAYTYAHRRERKGAFRRLWVLRIGIATKNLGLSYSNFIHGLKQSGVDINRKIMADLAVREPQVFAQLVEKAKGALAST